MTHLDQMIADALAQSPDTVVHQLATDRERLRGELEAARAEIADLKRGGVDAAELDAISDAIRCIGNDAHYASTGPAVPDALWDIRSRAYDVCAQIDGIRTIPALKPGEVAVHSARLRALEAIAEKIERLALGPDGRAWNPLHYREFARGELRAALLAQATTTKGDQP